MTAGGVQLEPALALGSWVVYRGAGASSMAMSDLVLADEGDRP